MKHAIRMCSLACALVIIAAPKAALGQSGTVLAEVLEDWSDLKASILQLVNYMPPDKYSYKLSLPVQVVVGTATSWASALTGAAPLPTGTLT